MASIDSNHLMMGIRGSPSRLPVFKPVALSPFWTESRDGQPALPGQVAEYRVGQSAVFIGLLSLCKAVSFPPFEYRISSPCSFVPESFTERRYP